MVQVKTTFFWPALPSSRLPQSVQKMREPIADMVVGCCRKPRTCSERKLKSDREQRLLRGERWHFRVLALDDACGRRSDASELYI